MSINSDYSKFTTTPLQTGQTTQLNEQSFVDAKQKQAQVIQKSADSNATEANSENGNNFAQTSERQPDELNVDEVNVKMRQLSLGVSFELTSEDENIVKVIDQETGDVVRQIPSEEFLEMSQRLNEIFGELSNLKGNLINNEV